jgi:hypothetical protein
MLIKVQYLQNIIFFEFESESAAGTNKNYEDAIKKARALYGSKVANEIKIDVIRLA